MSACGLTALGLVRVWTPKADGTRTGATRESGGWPQPLIRSSGARIMALDDPAMKMSKSIGATTPGHSIGLIDSPEVIRKAVMRSTTDSGNDTRFDSTGPGVANLLTPHRGSRPGVAPRGIGDALSSGGHGRRCMLEARGERRARGRTKSSWRRCAVGARYPRCTWWRLTNHSCVSGGTYGGPGSRGGSAEPRLRRTGGRPASPVSHPSTRSGPSRRAPCGTPHTPARPRRRSGRCRPR